MFSELATMQLMVVVKMTRLDEAGDPSPVQASLAKYTCMRTARSIASNARDLLGGNGILLANRLARHMADIEAIHTYEGTEAVQALIIGRSITGLSAFASPTVDGSPATAAGPDEANAIVAGLIRDTGETEVVKVKPIATQEIGLNEYLEEQGIAAFETDLAELIVQLDHDKPSHILVPAIHKDRTEMRDIFLREMPGSDPALTDDPPCWPWPPAPTGRMCLTLPETLITVMGVEELLSGWQDLEVFMQLLPRSSTGERVNPYTSLWTGVTDGDGPQNVHLVLPDNGRSAALADEMGRAALQCIRCSAGMNVCPVYERTGGHAHGSTYPGPIGAILSRESSRPA